MFPTHKHRFLIEWIPLIGTFWAIIECGFLKGTDVSYFYRTYAANCRRGIPGHGILSDLPRANCAEMRKSYSSRSNIASFCGDRNDNSPTIIVITPNLPKIDCEERVRKAVADVGSRGLGTSGAGQQVIDKAKADCDAENKRRGY